MEEKRKKIIEKILITMVIVLFVIFGFFIYQRYTEDVSLEKQEVVIDNYYNSEYLFNNNYIKIASTIDDFNNNSKDIYMYLDAENVFHIKDKNDLKKLNFEVKGLPKGDVKVYYNNLGNNCYEFAGLLEKDLYYTNFCLDNKRIYVFEKISTTTKEVYVPVTDKNGIYTINNDDITSDFVIDVANEMKYISFKDNILGLYNNAEDVRPYFDYICFDENTLMCDETLYYITFDKELVINYDIKNVIENDIGDNLIIQDTFGIFEIFEDKKVDLSDKNYKSFSNKYEYLFKLYVLDKDNNLYTIDMNNNSVKNKSKVVAISASNEKVKSISYEKDGNEKVKSVTLVYVNGKSEQLTSNVNKYIMTSTIYDKTIAN